MDGSRNSLGRMDSLVAVLNPLPDFIHVHFVTNGQVGRNDLKRCSSFGGNSRRTAELDELDACKSLLYTTDLSILKLDPDEIMRRRQQKESSSSEVTVYH